jgi:hypothetical protein
MALSLSLKLSLIPPLTRYDSLIHLMHARVSMPHCLNDISKMMQHFFSSREHEQPGPVLTKNGMEEYHIEKIVDERKRDHGYQYLVRWAGYPEGDNLWLP